MTVQPMRRRLHSGCGESLVSHVLDLFRQVAQATPAQEDALRREAPQATRRKTAEVRK